ncbi:MAG: AraC family transcriptional regulator ligand-binding domain-containing protein [Polyangiales bacterium]
MKDGDEPTIPAVQALHLADLARRWGVAEAALLHPLTARELRDPSRRLTVRELAALVERARALTGEPALGVHFGLRMQATSHGYLGFAAMAASTLGEAIALAARFAPTVTTAFSLRLTRGATEASLALEEEADLGPARDAVVLALVVGLWRMGCALTGRELDGRAELALPEPAYVARLRGSLPAARFGAVTHRLVFDAATLDLPLTTADPAALALAQEQCERAAEALATKALARARALVPKAGGGFRTREEVARRLGLSVRTLERRLAEGGASYRALLEGARRERAEAMLRAGSQPVEAIAEALGYSDAANFTRAFRRWTGATPAAWRKSQG